MQFTQKRLAELFATGARHGHASNIDLRELDDGSTALVGYGWATYAERSPSGEITLFEGWRGYSVSTSCQLTQIRHGLEAAGVDYSVSELPKAIASKPTSTQLIGETPIRS